jgi:serine/threonine-protein kinase
MQLIGGEDMFEFLNRLPSGARHSPEAIRTFAKVCDAVAFAHAREIVHLDLKPANFMIGFFGEVHVTDWGTARRLTSDELNPAPIPVEPQQRVVGGTIQYMCPEQANGKRVDKRSDVFALGACLCHILTGSAPYSGESRNEMLAMARNTEIEQARERIALSNADPILIRLALRCLQADPDQRPADGGEVARELAAYEHTALQTFERHMSRFFELSDDLFCIAGLDGYFRRINENFSRVLGYPTDTILKTSFLELIHPDDVLKTRAAVSQLEQGSHIRRFRNRYKTAQGRYVEFEWTARLIEDEGLIFAVARELD